MKKILLVVFALCAFISLAHADGIVFSNVFKPEVGTWNDDKEASLVLQLIRDTEKGIGCHHRIENEVFRYDYYVSKDKKLGCEKRTDKLSGRRSFFCFYGYRYLDGRLEMASIDQITDNGSIHNIRIDLEGRCL